MSATPVTVTVCSALQFDELKVSWSLVVPVTVPSPVSELTTSMTTFSPDAGCEASRTVKVAVAPDSSVSFDIAET